MAKMTEQNIALNYADPTREFVSVVDYLKNDNSYVLPYKKDIVDTKKLDDNCFHVSMMIEDEAVKAELADRTTFTDEDMKEEFITVDAIFYKSKISPETNGIYVNIIGKKDTDGERVNITDLAPLTDEEKAAFFEKVIETVPESREFVERSLNSVLDRMEQEKQTNKPVDVDR